jgi:polysaccharide biosynthesis/export protein
MVMISGRSNSSLSLWALPLLGSTLALGGCAYGGIDRTEVPPPSAEFLAEPDQLLAANRVQRLGPTDLLTIAVYRAPEFSGEYRVDTEGQIMMPLLGLVPVQGKTTAEVAQDLRTRLSQNFYVNPDVAVSLKESNSQRVVVDGSVSSPGHYPIMGRTTLMEAVARAGGASTNSNLRRVLIFRTIDGQRMVAGFDLAAIREAQAADPEVYPQDIIIVDGSQTRQAIRDIFLALPIVGLFRPFIY